MVLDLDVITSLRANDPGPLAVCPWLGEIINFPSQANFSLVFLLFVIKSAQTGTKKNISGSLTMLHS